MSKETVFLNHDADIAVLARETAEQMLARLALVRLQPQRMLLLSRRAAADSVLLQAHYPDAEIIALTSAADLSLMAENSIDLLFANLALPWCQSIEDMLREWQRILRPEGLLMLASFGPDTLREVQEREALLPKWIDMHDLGDVLAQVGFADPVLDVDYFTVTYREHKQLLSELQMTGMIAADQSILSVEQNAEGIFALTYEVVYGHAWGAETRLGYTADETGTVRVPLARLRRQRL